MPRLDAHYDALAPVERWLDDDATFALLCSAPCPFGPLDFNRFNGILAASELIRDKKKATLPHLTSEAGWPATSCNREAPDRGNEGQN